MKSHLDRKHEILRYISCLPRKMVGLHGLDNITEFVLYDLSGKDCFNFERAAYFVNNPDFNCLKGVAGFCRNESKVEESDIWKQPELFTSKMKESPFNQKVRNFMRCSLEHSDDSDELTAQNIAKDLGFTCHGYCSWNMKHDNHGLLVYQKVDCGDNCVDDYLLNGASLLSFCPIF